MIITEKLAQEFVELHNEKIREWHHLSGDSALNFFLQATQSQPGQDNGGEIVFEISGDDSRTGHPILFEVNKDRDLDFCADCGSAEGTSGCIQCFDDGRVGVSHADRIGYGPL